MEKTLDLKMPRVMELGREELRELEGGIPPNIPAYKILNEAISDFFQGIVDGFNDNNYNPN